jgi:dephospho-CoA kinase
LKKKIEKIGSLKNPKFEKMKTIGVTGGIGSGKSYVCRLLEERGYPVYYADNRAKNIMDTNHTVKNAIISLLGPKAYSNQKLNKTYVSSRVFGDNTLREKVNEIVHPAVRNDFEEWKRQHASSKLIFNEAAILLETGRQQFYDALILVYAPLELRIERIQKRDGLSLENIQRKINAQWPDNRKKKLTPFHICNDGILSIQDQIDLIITKLNKPF